MSEQAPIIMHITAPARVGGLERVVSALAAGHAERGFEIHVVAITDGPADVAAFFGALRSREVHTHEIRAPQRAYLRERGSVRSLCRRIRPDVVHTHGYRTDVLSAGVARGLGIATVTTVHGFTGGDLKNRLYEWLQVKAFRRFDAVVAVSHPMADRLAKRGVPKARLRTILNAWSPSGTPADRLAARRALALPVDGTVVGWVGRLTHEKGADVLLDAFASAPALPPRLSIVGAGPELDALQVQARSRGLEGRVQWHGFVPDAGQLLSAFDVFVLSSRTEGTPIALFEAMAAGVPIVATSVGGVPDVITDAEALLVPPEDPLALATAIRRVVDDPRVAAQRAAAARLRLAEKFAVDPWLSAYENVYRSVARGPGSPT